MTKMNTYDGLINEFKNVHITANRAKLAIYSERIRKQLLILEYRGSAENIGDIGNAIVAIEDTINNTLRPESLADEYVKFGKAFREVIGAAAHESKEMQIIVLDYLRIAQTVQIKAVVDLAIESGELVKGRAV